jgi:RNA polymerase sigma-32 factor
MRRVQAQIEREATQRGETLDTHQLHEAIASHIGVPLHDVVMMDGRLSGMDFSLNAQQSSDEEGREWIDTIEDDANHVEDADDAHDQQVIRGWLRDAMGVLKDREKYIIEQRKLIDEPRTLESLGEELNLSKERIRQLEAAALTKMHKFLTRERDGIEAFL